MYIRTVTAGWPYLSAKVFLELRGAGLDRWLSVVRKRTAGSISDYSFAIENVANNRQGHFRNLLDFVSDDAWLFLFASTDEQLLIEAHDLSGSINSEEMILSVCSRAYSLGQDSRLCQSTGASTLGINCHRIAPSLTPRQSRTILKVEMQLSFKNGLHGRGSSLVDLKRGEEGVVEGFDLPDDVTRRLMELGFLPGGAVVAGRAAPGGDPRVFRVDGSEVALRAETARHIRLRNGKSNNGKS
jgi:ferrous iron transport protein A